MKKSILLVVLLALAVTVHAQYVPTPERAMSFNLKDDPRNWTVAFEKGTPRGFIAEMTINREDINHWSEMVAQQVDFSSLTLDQHYKKWLAMIKHGDPNVVVTEDQKEDGSIVVTYDSMSFDEISVRRFIKGPDGVYVLAYHVRHRLKTDSIWKAWTEILSKATLIPNPASPSK